jgi:hypothetical protein
MGIGDWPFAMKDYEAFFKLTSLHFQDRNVMVFFCV